MKIPKFDDDAFGYLEGDFDARVSKAEETTSEAKNPMIALTLEAINRQGEKIEVKDWLVAKDVKACLEKIQGFIKSAGLNVSDELTAAVCVGAEVQIVCKIENDAKYGRQTKVARYIGSPHERIVSDSNADVVGDDPGKDPGDPF